MLVVGLARGRPTPFDGQFLKEYDPGRDGVDPDGRPMMVHLVTTPDPAEALDAPTTDLLRLWQSVNPRQPARADGAANRPLTAFTVDIVA